MKRELERLTLPEDMRHAIHPLGDRNRGPHDIRVGEWVCAGDMPYALHVSEDSTGRLAVVTLQLYDRATDLDAPGAEAIFTHERDATLRDEFLLRDRFPPEAVYEIALAGLIASFPPRQAN